VQKINFLLGNGMFIMFHRFKGMTGQSINACDQRCAVTLVYSAFLSFSAA